MRQRLKNIFNKDRRGSNGNESSTSGGGAASIPVVPLLTSVPFSRTPCVSTVENSVTLDATGQVLQLSEMSLPSDCVVSQLTVCGSCGDIAAGKNIGFMFRGVDVVDLYLFARQSQVVGGDGRGINARAYSDTLSGIGYYSRALRVRTFPSPHYCDLTQCFLQ